jgi:hypothetical protein
VNAIKLVVLLLVGLAIGPAAHASPRALATDAITVSGPSSVITISTSSCRTPIRYSVQPGALPDGGSYDVTAHLRNKDGKSFGSDREWLEDGSSYRGSISPRCGKQFTSGTYVLDVKVTVNDYYLDPVETRTGSAKVRISVTRPAATKLVVRTYAYGSRGWQWTGRLTSAGRPVSGQRIDLWWDLPGWENYGVSKRTNKQGVAHWVSNPNGGVGGIRFQLRFPGSTRYASSRSAIFDLAAR